MAAIIDKYAKLFHSILYKYINLFSWKNFARFLFLLNYIFLILSKFLINLYQKNIIQQ